MPSKILSSPLAIWGLIALGCLLRFYGLDWGTDRQSGTFHRFHTDESTLVESAEWVGVDMTQIRSSYGKAPMYLLRASALLLSPFSAAPAFDLHDNASARFTFLTGRRLSALMGTLLVYLVYLLGKSLGGRETGLLAALLMAVCPGHIQQSHFFTVDPMLTFLVALGLVILLQMPARDWRLYIAFGLVCGLAAGTRFVGAWVGLPFLILHLFKYRPQTSIFVAPINLTRSETARRIGVVIGIGAMVLVACEPFLILDPQQYFSDSDVRQFAASLQVARGEIIRVWTLYDFNTTPYLYYLTHLFRYALGFPLEAAGLLGLGLALVKRSQPAVILLGWFFAYGFLVCGLHTKPIRYATPLLPVLVVFGAWACLWAGQKARDIWAIPFLGVVPLLLVALPTCVYGIAFTAIYGQEDSRIVAERWIAENIPKGSQVLAEKGGFSTAWMLPEDRYHTQFTDSSFFVFSDKWELYSAQIDFFENRIRQVDWVVLIEENRMAPFVSVPDRYPIGSAIYARLNREELGYTRTAQFKNLPWLNLSTFGPGADPTLTCFDHPTIQVYRRASDASPEALLGRWKAEVQKDPRFPDSDVLSGISAFKLQNWPESRNAFERALALDSNFVLANLLIGEIHIKNNQMDSTQAIWDRVLARDVNINKYAFMGMINAGLREEGVFYLENIARRPGEDPNLIRLAGQTHSKIAGDYQQKGDLKTALSHSLRAVDLTPEEPVPYLNAAFVCLDLGDLEQAQTLTDRAEALSPGNPMAMHAQAVLLDKKGQRDLACQILLRALSKDPKNPNHQNLLLRWGAQYQQQGRTDLAFAVFHDILMYSPDFQEARYNLGTMYLQAGDFARALPELEKAVTLKPQDPDAQFALAGVYETLGHTDRAVQHYRNALILQPDYPQAKDRLESLPVP